MVGDAYANGGRRGVKTWVELRFTLEAQRHWAREEFAEEGIWHSHVAIP
jgi:hypothetical protein